MDKRPWIAVAFAVLLAGLGCRYEPEMPLAVAAAAGDIDRTDELLSNGAEIDEVDGSGMTALAWAARSGQVEVIHFLVAEGAEVDRVAGSNGWGPLVHAIHKHQNATAHALLEAGAETAGAGWQRALRMAARYGNAEIVRALLARGVDPYRQSNGINALTEAVGGAWDLDYRWRGCEPHTETVRALLSAAPDLRLPDNGWSILARHHARKKGCTEMLALIGEPEETPGSTSAVQPTEAGS
jgi:hypothetical protein